MDDTFFLKTNNSGSSFNGAYFSTNLYITKENQQPIRYKNKICTFYQVFDKALLIQHFFERYTFLKTLLLKMWAIYKSFLITTKTKLHLDRTSVSNNEYLCISFLFGIIRLSYCSNYNLYNYNSNYNLQYTGRYFQRHLVVEVF